MLPAIANIANINCFIFSSVNCVRCAAANRTTKNFIQININRIVNINTTSNGNSIININTTSSYINILCSTTKTLDNKNN